MTRMHLALAGRGLAASALALALSCTSLGATAFAPAPLPSLQAPAKFEAADDESYELVDLVTPLLALYAAHPEGLSDAEIREYQSRISPDDRHALEELAPAYFRRGVLRRCFNAQDETARESLAKDAARARDTLYEGYRVYMQAFPHEEWRGRVYLLPGCVDGPGATSPRAPIVLNLLVHASNPDELRATFVHELVHQNEYARTGTDSLEEWPAYRQLWSEAIALQVSGELFHPDAAWDQEVSDELMVLATSALRHLHSSASRERHWLNGMSRHLEVRRVHALGERIGWYAGARMSMTALTVLDDEALEGFVYEALKALSPTTLHRNERTAQAKAKGRAFGQKLAVGFCVVLGLAALVTIAIVACSGDDTEGNACNGQDDFSDPASTAAARGLSARF